jgi:hypothetical protein
MPPPEDDRHVTSEQECHGSREKANRHQGPPEELDDASRPEDREGLDRILPTEPREQFLAPCCQSWKPATNLRAFRASR